jgi:hypothetical protein
MKDTSYTSQKKAVLNPVFFQQPAHKVECKVFINAVSCANM